MNPDLLQLSPSQARIALDEHQRLRRATERREHERNFDYSHLHPLLRECPFACHYIKDFGLILVLGTNLGITTAFRAALRRCGWVYDRNDNNFVLRCKHAGAQIEIRSLREWCCENRFRFKISTTPLDHFYCDDVLAACGKPTAFERIDGVIRAFSLRQCQLALDAIVNAVETTDGGGGPATAIDVEGDRIAGGGEVASGFGEGSDSATGIQLCGLADADAADDDDDL